MSLVIGNDRNNVLEPGAPLQDPVQAQQESTLDKVKRVVGYILLALGAVAFIAGCVATCGQLFGVALIAESLAATFFTGGISALAAGFGLLRNNGQ